MSARAWTKKTILLALHACVAGIVTVLLWVYSPAAGLSAWVVVPWGLYLAMTFVLGLLPDRWLGAPRFDPLFIGTEALLIGTILSAYFRTETWVFYPLLLLAVLLAALARRLVWAIVMGGAVAVALMLVHLGDFDRDVGVLILQTGLILSTSGVIGYLTEELQREEETTRLLDNALEISTLMAGALDAEEVYDRLTDLVARLFRAGRVAVILVDPTSGAARVAAAVDAGQRVGGVPIDLDHYPEIQAAIERRSSVIISRAGRDPAMAGVVSRLPERAREAAILVTPILQDEEVRGVVFARLEDPRRTFTDHELKFCRIMADAAGQALQRAEHYAEVSEAARRDPLTGLYNMRIFHRRLGEEVDRSDRNLSKLSLIMIDIDYLKHVNDTYGHLAGDRVIRRLARTLLAEVRNIDTVARYGGEEFALLLPDADGERARLVADRVRSRIAAERHEGISEPVTVSVGIATYPDDAQTPTDLLHKADQALYASKHSGRNRSTHYGSLETIPAIRGTGAERPLHLEAVDFEDDQVVGSIRSALERMDDREVGHHHDVIASLTEVMGAKNPDDSERLKNASTVAELYLAHLPIPERQRWTIHVACLLRDIGKLAISEELLSKRDFLTREEYEMVRQHPLVSARILAPLRGFEGVVPYVRHHHERWDGKGYPDGLVGEEIPYGARVVGLIDAFQAMVHRRPYADRARGLRYACEEIRRNSGTQFDPELAQRFLHVVDLNRDILETLVGEQEPVPDPDANPNGGGAIPESLAAPHAEGGGSA